MRVREYEMCRKDEGETDRPCRNPRNLSALSPDRTDKKIHSHRHTNACVCALLLNPFTLSEAAFLAGGRQDPRERWAGTIYRRSVSSRVGYRWQRMQQLV
jgi:hypothetical protein